MKIYTLRIAISLMIFLLTFCKVKETEVDYYQNGQVKSKVEVSNGKYDGVFYEYYENGTLKVKSEWQEGVANGSAYHYFPNGQLKSQAVWVNGKPNGLFEEFFENGKMAFKGVYKEGVNIDTVFFYYESGEIMEQQVFDERGVCIDAYRFDTKGKKRLDYTQPLTYSAKDTVSLGELLKLEIRLSNRMSDSLQVLIGSLNKGRQLIDTTQVINGHLVFDYSFKTDHSGKDSITGIINQYVTYGDTTQVNHYPFTHSFYVK